jgi:Clp amino terminal domain, pathogenicity island component
MAQFPVPLDNLINYVESIHPDGGPLDHVTDAFTVSNTLNDEIDALLGHFVDQARRSGATWNQIGSAMGVTKQAAQKRFVPGKFGDFSRFTDRARNVMLASGLLAGESAITAAQLAAATLVEPLGIAAKMVKRAGLTPEQVYDALATSAAPSPDVSSGPSDAVAGLHELGFDESGKDALKSAVKAAWRFGHNYIGTEHLLIGAIDAGGPAADALAGLGLTPEAAREFMAAEFAEIQAAR